MKSIEILSSFGHSIFLNRLLIWLSYPLMLSPTICRYFAPPTSHRPFRLPTYSASHNLHTRTRPRRSSTLPFCYSFGHYLLNLLSHLGFAFVLPTYGIDPYSNIHILKPRHGSRD